MKYANNPQSVINGFYSNSRNVFLTVSIAIAMYGFSNSFNIGVSQHGIKDISLLIFLFSLMTGINNVVLFNNYIKGLEKEELAGAELPLYLDLNGWKRYLYIKIYFLVLLVCIITAVFVRLYIRRFVK
jgi:hypothetical protein